VKPEDKGTTTNTEVKEGKTKPPARLTEGDLISLMKSAGKYISDEDLEKVLNQTEGLGTEATRASIIKRLKTAKYIEIKKNMVYSTKKERTIIEVVGESILTSAQGVALP
jgi:DNA topoisomerase-3